MKVVKYRKYGSPEVVEIREADKPVPGDKEILIRNKATVVTPPDCAGRKGEPFIIRFFSGFFSPRNVPGDVMAGIVEAVGNGVSRFKVGDEVYGSSGTGEGAHGEFNCLPEDAGLALIPDNMTFDGAAALSEGFLTALPFLRDSGKITSGMKILINGASGNVGSTAVQLAKYYGAHVTAVCSGGNRDLVLSLGADEVIDYKINDFTSGDIKYDLIFDAVGKSSFSQCRNILKENGLYMSTVPTLPLMLKMLFQGKSRGPKALFSATGLRKPEEKSRDLEFMNELVIKGQIKPLIDRHYSFSDIAEAHRYVDTGRKKGSVVIDFN